MNQVNDDKIRNIVREQYGKVAEAEADDCCSPTTTSCCGTPDATVTSINLGYSDQEVAVVPEGANMGLGCGNPQAIASLKKGETVLDLGSGGGFDCFLAAKQVGNSGTVIGVDMTPKMLTKARQNAATAGYKNVEFRLGEIEYLPVADNSVDVILSNCVINLSPQKEQVFKEAFRVLKSNGRLAISDVVATAELPESLKNDMKLLTGCMAGAFLMTALEKIIKDAGFSQIEIQPKDESREFIREWAPNTKIEDYVVSATIEAIKP